MSVAFSRTIEPQSAVGGWMPSPRKDSAAIVRNTKQNRKPNSATSGGRMFGRTSRVMIQPSLSPCRRAASTKSSTTTFMATARVSRNTRVESSTAMIRIRLVTDDPKIDSSISAKMSWGIAIRMSTPRASSWSVQPPRIAARSPSRPPIVKESPVVITAIPIVLRAP